MGEKADRCQRNDGSVRRNVFYGDNRRSVRRKTESRTFAELIAETETELLELLGWTKI